MSGHFYIPKPPSYLRFTSSLILWEVNMKNEGGGKFKPSLVPQEASSKLKTLPIHSHKKAKLHSFCISHWFL